MTKYDDARNMSPEERAALQGPGAQAIPADELKRREIERAPLLQNAYQPKMTNRERAKELDNQIMLNGRFRQGDQSVDLIERALDEAEKRGFIDGTNVGWKNGKALGQEAMRERAANVPKGWVDSKSCGNHDENPCCHVRLADTILGMIRALPIQGETLDCEKPVEGE